MGYSTRYLGGPRIDPPLNLSEVAWLRAYSATRTMSDDPYEVAMNPGADHLRRADRPDAVYETVHPTPWRDSLGRDWEPTTAGCHLSWVPCSRGDDGVGQLRYLIDHFLGPQARAALDARDAFSEFTFDHVLNGFVAAERSDGRFTLIRIHDNEVEEAVLTSGTDDLW